ncbi:limb region 1 protein homolog isoform X3 [Hypanus sabinus]|uniref:limb region 1 protein homolog isoform X3 n=1 Tax=Hypanus sabinus TaxID=79690 RepID=UPI0028C50C72|nr:limb region 1 protein homolog isoform X3 [Hypanus sabinus]
MDADDVTIREQNFHSQVREYIICFLLFTILYTISYFIITKYKRKPDDNEDEDAIVNRISLYLCTFTLAVSAGAVLLLPFSIISNEILLSFPQMYYIQWLNGSLIHGLWNLVSLFSNLSLFVLMPFAYFFLESEGFAGSKKGIRARILETVVMLILLGLLIFGIVWVASALIDNDAASMESLYDLWEFYLPYLYSCISLMGGLLLLLCTPVGLSRMFTVMGQLLVKPTILEDLDEQIYCTGLQEEALIRRLNGAYMTSYLKYNSEDLEQELDAMFPDLLNSYIVFVSRFRFQHLLSAQPPLTSTWFVAYNSSSILGGVCFMINSLWCFDEVVLSNSCFPDHEYLMNKCFSFCLPRDDFSVILSTVCIPPVANYNQVLEILHEAISKQETVYVNAFHIIVRDFSQACLKKSLLF